MVCLNTDHSPTVLNQLIDELAESRVEWIVLPVGAQIFGVVWERRFIDFLDHDFLLYRKYE